jgi:Asp-tRNA(Asn)/Glu-tRNA(Gln) amidotransferase A subunit family amidase
MARYVDDLQLLLPIFAKADPTTDPDVAPHDIHPDPPQSLRVAIFTDDGLCPVDPAIREAVRAAGRALADAGHEVVEERPPNQAEVREVFESIALAETIGLLWPLIEPREEELSPQIRRLLARRETLSVDLPTYAGQLAYRLDLERAVAAWQATNQIMVCPISATPAFPIGTEVLEIDGQEYEEIDLFSLSTYENAMSLPAVAVPAGTTPDGLPIGVQVVGRRYREMEVLAVAKELEDALGGWIKPGLEQAAAN